MGGNQPNLADEKEPLVIRSRKTQPEHSSNGT
nr:MAG TPA: hypothetical protein [Caudoviricetes sp.]